MGSHVSSFYPMYYRSNRGIRFVYFDETSDIGRGGIHVDSSTCFGPTGPSSGASINCVLLVWYVKTVCCLVRPYVRRFHNHLTYGRTEQHTIFTYQTSNTQFMDAPEDGPVGPKHVELSNIL